jgi:protease-4
VAVSVVGRTLIRLFAAPVGFAARAVHRLATGTGVVLDVTIAGHAGLWDRDVFFRRLRRAAHDPHVAAVLLRIEAAPAGWAACQDLREAIGAIRAAGKPVYAFLEVAGNAATWIASVSDRVFLLPTADMGLVGIGVELTFFGAGLSRLGIRPDFEAAGAYKSFGEPLTRSFASPANQEAIGDLVADLHEQLVSGIAEGRGLAPDVVRDVLRRAPLSAADALEVKLVDQLAYEDQVVDWLKERHGSKVKLLPFRGWAIRDAVLESISTWGTGTTTIAVLHMQGPVVLVSHGTGTAIAAHTIVPMLKRLADDDEVGAVVLHVDSPGGSALASDVLWRSVDELRRKKPVVASFEDVAASGGYYLAAPANVIVARSGTLTGSIGVFGGKLVAGEGLRRAGIHTQEVAGAPNANLHTTSRPFTADQRARFRASLQRVYDGFVQRVATGRGRPIEEIEPHCRGRVWTGRAAASRGLVDLQGDLGRAIAKAASLAGVSPEDTRRRDLSAHREPFWAKWIQGALRQAIPAAGLLRGSARLLAGIELIARHEGEALTLLPYDIEVR